MAKKFETIWYECPGDECFVAHDTHFGVSDQSFLCLNCGSVHVPHDVIMKVGEYEDVGVEVAVSAESEDGYAQLEMFE